MTRLTALAVVLIGTSGAAAQSLPPLEKDPTVVSGFYAIGLADEIRKNCDSISPRLIRAWSFLQSLKGHARDAGYSSADIKALQDNREAKRALQERIRAELTRRGATPETPQGYCEVGREEIARDSSAGRLLYEN